MKLYTTEIKAIDPISGDLKTWQGQHVPGSTQADAVQYCQQNGLGYCEVIGELVSEKQMDFTKANQN